jgi:hypothetical protein
MIRSRFRPLLAFLALAHAAAAQSAAPAAPRAATEAASPATAPGAPTDAAGVATVDPYEAGVHAFARGDFGAAIRAFDEVLAAPASADRAARAAALRDLAQRYVKTGARLVFPSGNIDAAKNPLALPDERTDDEIVSYYLTSVPYGIFLGIYAADLAGADSAAGVVFPILGAVGLTAGAMAYADSVKTRAFGEPQAVVSGAGIGLQAGIPLVALVDPSESSTVTGMLLATTTMGGAAGWLANRAYGTTPGEMSFVGSAALWSNVLGALTGVVTGAKGDDYAGISLASIAVGTTVGALYARDVAPSIAHVRYIDFGALAGGLAIGGSYLALAGSSGNEHAAAAITAAGVLGGGALATYLTRGMAREESRRATAIQWSPTVAPLPGGATVGVAGTF